MSPPTPRLTSRRLFALARLILPLPVIVKRFIAVFYPSAEYEVTKRQTIIEQASIIDTFRTEGRVLIKPASKGTGVMVRVVIGRSS